MGRIICLEFALAFIKQGALLRSGVDHLQCKRPTWSSGQPPVNDDRCELEGMGLPYPPPSWHLFFHLAGEGKPDSWIY